MQPMSRARRSQRDSANVLEQLQAIIRKKQSSEERHYEYEYADEDQLGSEISEMFSFAEIAFLPRLRTDFEEVTTGIINETLTSWEAASPSVRYDVVSFCLCELDGINHDRRRRHANALLYIALGVPHEVAQEDTAQRLARIKENVALLRECGGFATLVQYLATTRAALQRNYLDANKSTAEDDRLKADYDMRICLDLLLLLVQFVHEPSDWWPSRDSKHTGHVAHPSLVEVLFELLDEFNEGGVNSVVPIKKVLLLLWKCLHFALGTIVPKQPSTQERSTATPRAKSDDLTEWQTKIAKFCHLHGFTEAALPPALALPLEILRKHAPPPPPRDPYAPPPATPFEALYVAIWRQLPRYLIILQKVFLGAMETASIDLMSDALSKEVTWRTHSAAGVVSMTTPDIVVDMKRHREIIMKAVSCILLVLAKHAKHNRLEQYEYITQTLVDANGILLLLKFMEIDFAEFFNPSNPFPVDKELFAASPPPSPASQSGASLVPVWRNFTSFINVMRLLHALTKRNLPRQRVLVNFKAQNSMKKVFSKIVHPLAQRYALKLTKSCVPLLNRKWRQANMKMISAIWCTLRADLIDKWLSTDLVDSEPSEAEEQKEREEQDRVANWHRMVYGDLATENAAAVVSTSGQQAAEEALLRSVEECHVVLDEQFTRHYEQWVDEQVFDEHRHRKWEEAIARLEPPLWAE